MKLNSILHRRISEVVSWWEFCRASSERLAADPDIASAREHLELLREDWRISELRRKREECERPKDEHIVEFRAKGGQNGRSI